MSKHYFTSDWHLFGINFLKNPLRSMFNNVEEMNETIIENIMTKTKPGDNLYFLGDMGWKFPENYLNNLFTKFKKHKLNFFWIEGNHDANLNVESSCIKWRGQIKNIVVDKQPIALCHYPLIVWNKSHYDGWNLFGHIHYEDSTWKKLFKVTKNEISKSKRCNVNTELYNFRPLEFEEIKFFFDVENFDGNKVYRNFDLIERGSDEDYHSRK